MDYKAKLEELIRHVEYIPPQNVSQRRGLDREAQTTTPAEEPLVEIVGSGRPTPEAASDLGRREQEAWQRVLGVRAEIKPLPESITPEVRRNLERLGFDLRYVPAIDLGTVDNLKRKGAGQYLKDLQRVYPNWKP